MTAEKKLREEVSIGLVVCFFFHFPPCWQCSVYELLEEVTFFTTLISDDWHVVR